MAGRKPFMESLKYPTLTHVVPLYNQLISDLEKWSRDPKKTIATRSAALAAIKKLNKYYSKLSPVNIVAVFFNPNLKYTYFRSHGWTYVEGENLLENEVIPM